MFYGFAIVYDDVNGDGVFGMRNAGYDVETISRLISILTGILCMTKIFLSSLCVVNSHKRFDNLSILLLIMV